MNKNEFDCFFFFNAIVLETVMVGMAWNRLSTCKSPSLVVPDGL